MDNQKTEKVGVVGYLALLFAAVFFSGIFAGKDGILSALDFQTYLLRNHTSHPQIAAYGLAPHRAIGGNERHSQCHNHEDQYGPQDFQG